MELKNPTVRIVFDGKNLIVPQEMGTPQPHHLLGSKLDNLIELAGRVCYDSLKTKKSRNSHDYHKHIAEVNHGSVQEHAVFSFAISKDHYNNYELFNCFLNRPGLFVRERMLDFVVTTNIRAAREWNSWNTSKTSLNVGKEVQKLAKKISPLSMFDIEDGESSFQEVLPETEDEIWISFYIGNVSRGLTHELIRHGDWTAISQRSTRYVDESKSHYSWHPIFRIMKNDGIDISDLFKIEEMCKKDYETYQKIIQKYLESKNYDEFTAKKQSRGAARGILGNALSTELIFSASLAQWKRIIMQRGNLAADDEIRELACDIFLKLKEKFEISFLNWTLSKDKDKFFVKTNS